METRKFQLTQSHFTKAVQRFKNPKHQEWIKTYFPFKETELELPQKDTIAFSSRDWAESIWEEYIKLCNRVAETPVLDPWRTGFYKFFGGPDFEFIEHIEAVLLEEGAFTPDETTPPPTPTKGWVYLIKNQELHKIGITKNLLARMKQLEVHKKTNELIHAVRSTNYLDLEKDLHLMFKAVRIPQSEYFRLSEKQVSKAQKYMDKNALH